MPKIKGTQSQTVEVEVSDTQLKLIVSNYLRKTIGLHELGEYERSWYMIQDGAIYYEYLTGGGSHSWFEKDKIREATELDKAVFAVLAEINKKET